MTQPASPPVQKSVEDLLFGGSAPSIKWELPGTEYRITVTDKAVRQRRTVDTNELQWWDDGSPKMQILLTGPAEIKNGKGWVPCKDPALEVDGATDDGVRTLYITGRAKANPGSTMEALTKAMRSAGSKTVEIGCVITMKHESGVGTPKKPRTYSATYTAPVPTDAFDAEDSE